MKNPVVVKNARFVRKVAMTDGEVYDLVSIACSPSISNSQKKNEVRGLFLKDGKYNLMPANTEVSKVTDRVAVLFGSHAEENRHILLVVRGGVAYEFTEKRGGRLFIGGASGKVYSTRRTFLFERTREVEILERDESRLGRLRDIF